MKVKRLSLYYYDTSCDSNREDVFWLNSHSAHTLPILDQVDYVTKKSRRLSGLIVRYITYKSPSIMIPLFKALVRPVLEYGNVVWCPSKRTHICQIESKERHFTKCINGMGDLEYCERHKALGLSSLECRRLRGDLF